MKVDLRPPLLRVPPFPGSRPKPFTRPTSAERPRLSDEEADRLLGAIRAHKVGGTYWAPQPDMPEVPYTLIHVRSGQARVQLAPALPGDGPVVCWVRSQASEIRLPGGAPHPVFGACDPWHLLSRAAAVVADADDELTFLAAIAGVPVQTSGQDAPEARKHSRAELRNLLHEHVVRYAYADPYTGEPLTAAEAIALCGFWRRLIDGNRQISSAIGFARWKRRTVAPLLWSGSGDVPFESRPRRAKGKGSVAIWKSRVPSAVVADLQACRVELIEVEDGFIRSAGLGADCVPPLSIVVDRLGIFFDPSCPSDLEKTIEEGVFSEDLLQRARELRQLIVESGLSKYAVGRAQLERRAAGRRHILVVGQVEDDRSVMSGGGPVTTNLELLRRARHRAPDAYLLYKPHPDVEAGHRTGGIPDAFALTLADEIVREPPIAALIETVDEVHVNTSLAGFEALLREKAVTTHGVPFYAGWGLTRDLGAVPERRTARRTIDELVAAALLLYPRYLDPDTGLPCPPEVLVRRLVENRGQPSEPAVVGLRRLQGRSKRLLARLRPW